MVSKYFYLFKPFISRKMQFRLRRLLITMRLNKYKDIWPIDQRTSERPNWFKGWPEGKRFAFILTHDVEQNHAFANKIEKLLSIDKKYGIRSSVGLVPERYHVGTERLEQFRKNDTEIYVHDLNHDGRLFSNYQTFHKRAQRINNYLQDWKVNGFRAGAMHHELNWIGELDILYDMSTFDTDPFEPMPDGVKTIFPFVTTSHLTNRLYVEIPYTLPQDLMTLVLHPKRSIDIWIEKLNWIVKYNGMVSINIHPDYIAFKEDELSYCNYRATEFEKFLNYIQENYHDAFWNPNPTEMSDFILHANKEMKPS